jgi:hypothetical protein
MLFLLFVPVDIKVASLVAHISLVPLPAFGNLKELSAAYAIVATPIWCKFERHAPALADFRPLLTAGTAKPAKRPIMLITTRSSTRVKAILDFLLLLNLIMG